MVYTTFAETCNKMTEYVHNNAKEKCFWDSDRNDGELIALIHSELSEVLEALREGNPKSEKIPDFTKVEEELADAVIRIMDMANARGYDLGNAIVHKHAYNKGRVSKHGKLF